MPNRKILSITIMQVADESSSTSDTFGRYTDKPGNEWAIDRSLDAKWDPHTSRYFTPEADHLIGAEPAEQHKYAREDYDRVEAYERGEWSYIGIFVRAVITLGATQDLTQQIDSGGSWGNASDESKAHLATLAGEQLDEVKGELLAIGFTADDIATALASLKREAA